MPPFLAVIEWDNHFTWWGIAAVAALLLILLWWSYSTSVGRPGVLPKAVLVTLRWAALLLGIACLLNPQRVERIEHPHKSALAVLLDTSRSMALQDADGSRLASAKQWLQQKVLPLAPSHANILPFAFDRALRPLSGSGPASFSATSPTGEVTALADAIENLLAVADNQPLSGILLCSDGIETERQDWLNAARLCRRKGIPIHTATFGSTNEMRDVVVENVQIKRATVPRAPTKAIVTLNSFGFQGTPQPVEVRLGAQVLARKTVVLTGQRQRIELEFKPDTRGFQIFNVYVPPQPGEWLVINNRRPFGLEVTDFTIQVLYMEGTPTQPEAPQPEWRYLKAALESDPQIKVTVLYRTRFRSGRFVSAIETDPATGENVYAVEHPVHGYPKTMAELARYDVIIHSDIPKETFTAEQLINTAKLVEELGGGFVMIGGKSAFGIGGYHLTVLDRFIPVAMEGQNDVINRPFKMQVPPTVLNHPLIALGATREETMAIWGAKFPYLYGLNRVARAKPGAVVLGVNPSIDGNEPLVVMAVQEVGKGRTMAFTSDITRSWGKDYETLWGEPVQGQTMYSEENCDKRYYRNFWINAVRWLAANKLGNTNDAVALELAQTTARPGEAVPLTVRVLDKSRKPTGSAKVSIAVFRGGTNVMDIPAQFDSTAQNYYARVTLPQAGDFSVKATATIGAEKLGEDTQLISVEASDPELQEVRARPDIMNALARCSYGETLNPEADESAKIKSMFGAPPPVTVEWRRHPFWDRAWLLGAMIALLAAEWVLRRRHGLV